MPEYLLHVVVIRQSAEANVFGATFQSHPIFGRYFIYPEIFLFNGAQ
jgi:hypothetical protein